MRISPQAQTNVGVKEEKEARLKAFVARHLESLADASNAQGVTYRLLALSPESPSAHALASLAPELAAAGVTVEIVFARRASSDKAASLGFATARYVSDVRLLDAHEQLVLDPAVAWIGDCMRRDPGRRDSFETYIDCPVTAANATRSFAQIWRLAGTASSSAAPRRWAGPSQPNLFDPSLIAGAEHIAASLPILRH